MKIQNILILLFLICFSVGCSKDDVSDNFNLKMQGITVVYFSEIKRVYLLENDTLFIPLSERDQQSLGKFIGDEGPFDLEFYLGEQKFGDFTLTGNTRYEALKIPYREEYAELLKQGGVRLDERPSGKSL